MNILGHDHVNYFDEHISAHAQTPGRHNYSKCGYATLTQAQLDYSCVNCTAHSHINHDPYAQSAWLRLLTISFDDLHECMQQHV